MALWGDAKLFFCILFITCCCTVTAQIPMDCCLSVRNQTIQKQAVMDYKRQSSGQGCNIDATILVTRRNIKLCVPADELWVQQLMRHVEWLMAHCKKNGYKGKRCSGLRRA